MATEVVWSRRARESLLCIYVAIGRQNPTAAEILYQRIESLAATLLRHPRMGPRRPDLRPTARMLVESPYLILYELMPDTDEGAVETVIIVAVVDGRRNVSGSIPDTPGAGK